MLTIARSRTGRALILACAAAALLPAPAASAAPRGDDGGRRVKLRAQAEDEASDFRFKAIYRARSDEDREKQRFKVRVWDAIPGEALDVGVNGLFVGWILVDESGNGRFRLRSRDMPEEFPHFQAGDFVSVGPLGTALEDRDRSARPSRHRLRMLARMGDDSGLQGKAKYDARTKKGRLRRMLKVSVEGAEEGDEFDVMINDELIGTIEADEFGEGSLRLRSRGADESFPLVAEADVVTIGDMSAPLALR